MSGQRSQAVSDAYQKAITLLEGEATGQPFDVEFVRDMEMALVLRALVHLGGTLIRSGNRDAAKIIEELRMIALQFTTEKR